MDSILNKIWGRKLEFLGTFFLVFTFTYILLMAFDFLPEPKTDDEDKSAVSAEVATEVELSEEISVADVETEEDQQVSTDNTVTPTEISNNDNVAVEVVDSVAVNEVVAVSGSELPSSIYIEKLDKSVVVNNPTSRTIADLDESLLSGVVRHPDSATLNQEGNVFILGHSSYLPNVLNKNFQAFNGIQNLEWGDKIKVYSDQNVYEYRVDKVYRAKAQDVTVPIAGTGNMLTLATCNSFGSVDDRYIVEAKLVNTTTL